MSKVDIRIMAVPKRRFHVLKMLEQLGLDESIVSYDDRINGGSAMYTARKAWLCDMDKDFTHRVVLQDDLLLCNNFPEIVERMANTHPEAIFSLFCSRTHFDMKSSRCPYVEITGGGIWGQAVMMSKSRVKKVFDWIDDTLVPGYPHDDRAMCYYTLENHTQVLTTIPSTVQHIAHSMSALGYNNYKKVSKVWIGPDLDGVSWDIPEYSKSPKFDYPIKKEDWK